MKTEKKNKYKAPNVTVVAFTIEAGFGPSNVKIGDGLTGSNGTEEITQNSVGTNGYFSNGDLF